MPTHDQKPVDMTNRLHHPLAVADPVGDTFTAQCGGCWWNSAVRAATWGEAVSADDMRQHLEHMESLGERVEFR